MAYAMFGGAPALPQSDFNLLEDIHAIKISNMAKRHRERMPSVSQILKGDFNVNEPYTR